MLKSDALENKMSFKEKEGWQSFLGVVKKDFLATKKDPNYRESVERLTRSFQNMGCQRPLKLHFLCSHLNFFKIISEISVRNTVKGFTRIYNQWKEGIRAEVQCDDGISLVSHEALYVSIQTKSLFSIFNVCYEYLYKMLFDN